MPVLAKLVASPILTAIVAAAGDHAEASKPVDPCRRPVFRFESANLAALPGPNAVACKDALQTRANEKKENPR